MKECRDPPASMKLGQIRLNTQKGHIIMKESLENAKGQEVGKSCFVVESRWAKFSLKRDRLNCHKQNCLE